MRNFRFEYRAAVQQWEFSDDGTGYLLASSQGANEFVVYARNGINDASGTDAIDMSNFSLGPLLPQGTFAA